MFVLALALAGCAGKKGAGADSGTCAALGVKQVEGGGNAHVASCDDASACGNGAEPPTGGPHCGNWLACGTYAEASPCKWIHNLEHGHLVLLYNCPSGCPEVVAKLEAFAAKVPASAGGAPRALVAPRSTLPGKVGAVVWGTSWVGDDVDEAALGCVLEAQDDAAPEPGLGCAAMP